MKEKTISTCLRYSGLVLAILLPLFKSAQFSKNDSLTVGKRGNLVWDRKISVFNMANIDWNYYYRIYYRTSNDSLWRKAGITGRHIGHFFKSDQDAWRAFGAYRCDKRNSYILLGTTISLLTGWTLYSAHELVRLQSLRAYLRPVSLALIGGYFISFQFGRKINIRGDLHLLRAVRILNQNDRSFHDRSQP